MYSCDHLQLGVCDDLLMLLPPFDSFSYKAPAEVGVQRVAGVSVDGGGVRSPEGIGGMQVGLGLGREGGCHLGSWMS